MSKKGSNPISSHAVSQHWVSILASRDNVVLLTVLSNDAAKADVWHWSRVSVAGQWDVLLWGIADRHVRMRLRAAGVVEVWIARKGWLVVAIRSSMTGAGGDKSPKKKRIR